MRFTCSNKYIHINTRRHIASSFNCATKARLLRDGDLGLAETVCVRVCVCVWCWPQAATGTHCPFGSKSIVLPTIHTIHFDCVFLSACSYICSIAIAVISAQRYTRISAKYSYSNCIICPNALPPHQHNRNRIHSMHASLHPILSIRKQQQAHSFLHYKYCFQFKFYKKKNIQNYVSRNRFSFFLPRPLHFSLTYNHILNKHTHTHTSTLR